MEERPTTCSQKIATICIGAISNLFFLTIYASAQRIVEHFEKKGYIGYVNWACTFCSFLGGYVNTMLSTCNFNYDLRYAINCLLMTIAILGCAFATNFWVCWSAIVIIGFSCIFGESVSLGYLAHVHRSVLVKFWGIGTGLAGIIGSAFSVLYLAVDISYRDSFLMLLPFVAIYGICYFCILREEEEDSIITEHLLEQNSEFSTKEEEEKVHCYSCNFFKKIFYYLFCIDIVYFAQYVITSAFLDCAQTKDFYDKHKYFFPLLNLVQHAGIMIFCSTLSLFECPYLGNMALCQMINFSIWLSQALLHWMPIWSEFIFIFLVGAFGGLSYANTYNMILKDNKLNTKEKELGSNVTSLTVTLSTMCSAIFTLISEKTYLKDFVPEI